MYTFTAVVALCLLVCRCSQVQAAAAQMETYKSLKDEVGRRDLYLSPGNTAVVAGERTSLRCAHNFSSLIWVSSPTGLPPYNRLVQECQLNPYYAHLYGLENVGPYRCDLVLLNATASQAIQHYCLSVHGMEPAQSAMIVVLETVPQCKTDTDDVIKPGVPVRLSCSVGYSSRFAPAMKWKDETGKTIPSTSCTSPMLVESHVTVTPVNSSQVITATTYFERPPADLPVTATNAPDYTYSWTIRLLPEPSANGKSVPGTEG